MRTIAITRELTDSIGSCELTHMPRQRIDVEKARLQHGAYREALQELGVEVICLADPEGFADGVFVEDPAVVVDEVAVIGRMASPARQREARSLAESIAPHRPLKYLEGDARLEGGDVQRVDRTLYVGLSTRTNLRGARELEELLAPWGYSVRAAEVTGCLHLKTGCSYLGRNTVLINRAWVPPSVFGSFDRIEVDPTEPFAANALVVGQTVLFPSAFPRTRARIEARGIAVRTVDISELMKAEAGLTCLSQIFSISG